MIKAIIFDWGDTIMKDFRDMSGPMAFWPMVEAVPGAAEALQALKPRYRLALATNAAVSGEALVRQALQRVGLEVHFDAVYTAAELGASKPAPRFFANVLDGLGVRPEEAVMVGDGYPSDMVGAKRAGLWAVWFNPQGVPCPLPEPIHDAEIGNFAALEDAIRRLKLPA